MPDTRERWEKAPGHLLSALKDRDSLWMTAEKVYVYARMKKDEDNRVSRYQELSQACAVPSVSDFREDVLFYAGADRAAGGDDRKISRRE